MSKLRSLLPYALAAYKWARAHKAVTLAATIAALHLVALIWTDVPSEAIVNAVSLALGS